MARPKPAEPHTNLGFRLPDSLIERIDDYAKRLKASVGGVANITRTDAIRTLLEKALAAEGFPAAEAKPAKRR